ncbi:hypothetical protein ACFRI7_11810 [Streptomyces sp. NPDC056716]|uniref:hypothetical protein n=1 Tax=unclassified Streptomyces TaxID=2593676 RepID=UPI0036774784
MSRPDQAWRECTREPAGLSAGIRASTTSDEVAEVLAEVTAAYDDVLALAGVVIATAGFHQDLGVAADPPAAEGLPCCPQPKPVSPAAEAFCPPLSFLPEEPMHDHEQDHDVEGFAAVLAGELSGRWSVDYRRHANRAEQMARAAAVWDMNIVADAIATKALHHDAILTHGSGTRLYLTGRPGHEDDFLVAAIAPALPPEAFGGVREPDGIAVPADPEAAAQMVQAGLLPRYQAALDLVLSQSIRLGLEESLTLTWSGTDLHAHAPSTPVREILTEHGFTPSPAGGTLVLAGDDSALQARTIRTVGARLAMLGTSLALRHPAPRFSPDSTAMAPAQQARPAARVR